MGVGVLGTAARTVSDADASRLPLADKVRAAMGALCATNTFLTVSDSASNTMSSPVATHAVMRSEGKKDSVTCVSLAAPPTCVHDLRKH